MIWFTGLSGAGKTTTARLLEQRLRAQAVPVEFLDGDIVRTYISKDLGFSRQDRNENVRRLTYLCDLLARNGITVIVAAVSPYRDARDAARAALGRFVEVHVQCPLEVLIRRDPKGLYKRALAGDLPNFTGVSDPYEAPLNPEIAINTETTTALDNVVRIVQTLEALIHRNHPNPQRQDLHLNPPVLA